MDRIFQVLAVIFVGIAAFFWWRENSDWAFAFGVLAASAFFFSMRFQMKERIKKANEELEIEQPADEASQEEE